MRLCSKVVCWNGIRQKMKLHLISVGGFSFLKETHKLVSLILYTKCLRTSLEEILEYFYMFIYGEISLFSKKWSYYFKWIIYFVHIYCFLIIFFNNTNWKEYCLTGLIINVCKFCIEILNVFSDTLNFWFDNIFFFCFINSLYSKRISHLQIIQSQFNMCSYK